MTAPKATGPISVRHLYLDRCPGERRGVVLLDGRPERLLIERDGETGAALGALYRGRVLAVSARMGLARLDLGEETASLRLTRDAPLAEGAIVEVEVTAEPRRGKGAFVALVAARADGRLGLLRPPPPLVQRLQAFAPDVAIVEGEDARDAADEAQAQALAREHTLPGGLNLCIETTRALVAVDVDLSEIGAPGSTLKANLAAIRQAARLLRLKALSGLVVVDLIGFPQEKSQVHAACLEAFAPDGGEVVIGPLSRFGALELSLPRRYRPLAERLLDDRGQPTARTIAQATVRDLQRRSRFEAGSRLVATCAPEVAAALRPLVAELGPMFQVKEAVGAACADPDISIV
jgi:Ribonuclease G/E